MHAKLKVNGLYSHFRHLQLNALTFLRFCGKMQRYIDQKTKIYTLVKTWNFIKANFFHFWSI